jgi:penicillin-binding protein 1C
VPKWLRLGAGWGLAASASVSLVAGTWIALPLPADVAAPAPVASLVVEDRHGLVLRTTRDDDGSRGGWIPYGDIDPDLVRAFVAVEDRRFLRHHGIDLSAVARAAWSNLRAGRVTSGASTITMQTARLLRPIPRSWVGKLEQGLWALRLEAHLDKDRIFELYLNRLPLGQGARGVAAASALYFGSDATDVSHGQAALLAALAHAPSRDNPLAAPERAERRRNEVLRRMATAGYITPDELDRATRESVVVASPTPRFLAPHFTTRLLLSEDAAEAELGVRRTTLDLDLQQVLEAEVRHTVAMLRDRGVRDAALVVLDNRSGGVLAWVGSPDFWGDRDGQVDMVVSARQPGSTLKPFLYGASFDRGVTAATVLPDVPHTYATSTGSYRPQNYDRSFRGPVRARVALASSLNVPAVDLAERIGAGTLLSTLRDAGFASLDGSAEFYGLGLALGNGEVTLLELANAFRGLAAGGVWRPVRMLLDDGDGSADGAGQRFLSAGAAALVLDILVDPVARIPGFGAETPFDFPFPAAAKTGTSRHFTDNWAVATTAGFTVAVWVGNFNGQPMEGVSGVTGAGPLLYRAVLQAGRRYAPGYLPTPEQAGAVARPVCMLSGLRATPECPSTIEWFMPGTEPTLLDDWQRNGYTALPPAYAEWERSRQEEDIRIAGVPASDSVGGAPAPTYVMVSPQDGDRYMLPPGVAARYATISLTALGPRPDEPATWYVDGERIRGTRWAPVVGTHTFRVVWASGRSAEATVVVE